jgi:hypothetical protein
MFLNALIQTHLFGSLSSDLISFRRSFIGLSKNFFFIFFFGDEREDISFGRFSLTVFQIAQSSDVENPVKLGITVFFKFSGVQYFALLPMNSIIAFDTSTCSAGSLRVII